MQKIVERQGASSEPYVRHYPKIRAGQCEYCGTLDPNVSGEFQYKLCPHFRNFGQLRCSYCPDHRNPDEVNKTTILNVHDHPSDPSKIVVVCSGFECSRQHEKRFRLNT